MIPSLIISVDGLNARFLGAYGNRWVPTPVLDALASRSVLFDSCFCETFDCHRNLLSVIVGQSPLLGLQQPVESVLPTPMVLITDDSEVAEKLSPYFEDVLWMPDARGEAVEPDSPREQLFEFAFAEISRRESSGDLLPIWIHCKGMFGEWEAALETQEFFKDEGDTPPCRFSEVPAFQLGEEFDPDDRTLVVHGYAAEVVEFDRSLGQFLEILDQEIGRFDVSLFGTRGFPLGEHREIGNFGLSCYVEKFHVPCFVAKQGLKAPIRIPSMTGISELGKTLWHSELSKPGEEIDGARIIDWHPEGRQILTLQSSGFARIQTPAWSYIHPWVEGQQTVDEKRQGELFARRCDRLELNEVSAVCPEICTELRVELARRVAAYASRKSPGNLILSDPIYTGIS
ncbi:MAG: hypothetical protein VX438_13110 [Planctomycetota bacterium]|nr:hypothetical protein [Planctomycetota bacterium]